MALFPALPRGCSKPRVRAPKRRHSRRRRLPGVSHRRVGGCRRYCPGGLSRPHHLWRSDVEAVRNASSRQPPFRLARRDLVFGLHGPLSRSHHNPQGLGGTGICPLAGSWKDLCLRRHGRLGPRARRHGILCRGTARADPPARSHGQVCACVITTFRLGTSSSHTRVDRQRVSAGLLQMQSISPHSTRVFDQRKP